jgi:hypothetical protein
MRDTRKRSAASTIVAHLLVIPFFLPIYLLLPSGIRSTIYNLTLAVDSNFRNFSDLQLDFGETCDQSRTNCIKSFILDGEISNGDASTFLKLFNKMRKLHPEVHIVCLNSGGGFNGDASMIARHIKDAGFDTCVGDLPLLTEEISQPGIRYTASCESACTLIVLAGKRRIALGDRFKFGVHATKMLIELSDKGDETPTSEKKSATDSPGSDEVSYMSKAAADSAFEMWRTSVNVSSEELFNIFEATKRTPGSRMYYLSPKEQMGYGFFTERRGIEAHST